MSKQVVSISDAVPYQEFAKLIGKTPAAVRGMIEKGKLPDRQRRISPPGRILGIYRRIVGWTFQ